MKKMMMMLVMALTAVMLVGCSKASKFESLLREGNSIAEKIPENKRPAGVKPESEENIKKAVEEFKKMSSEEQELALKAAELAIQGLKKVAEDAKK